MRRSGILMPVFSLPSRRGIGTLGKAAYNFVDFLAAGGQSLWQMLPMGPTSIGDSPYQSFSSMAGNPYFIDLDLLVSGGLLKKEDVAGPWGSNPEKVDYGLMFKKRFDILAKAVKNQNKTEEKYIAFCRSNSYWLDDYAMFMAIKEAHGHVSFQEWPEGLRTRQPDALKQAEAMWGPRIEFWRCLQYLFFKQWKPLKAYANANGIELVGDIPIYVSPDSSDLWANPGLFQVDGQGRPSRVAGVPPDAFSDDGQLWGNPLYNWKAHKRTGYKWWVERLRFTADMFDIIRIDHFRGFAGYYSIPAGDTTAKNGRWEPGPAKDFIRMLHKSLPGVQIIAEDLGVLTPDVYELMEYSGYPGMKVLQFAFGGDENNDYLPHNYGRNSVVYTGTHDNRTTEEWAQSASKAETRHAREYFSLGNRKSLTQAMIKAALSSVADTAIIPMQDWLSLGKNARINIPSTLGGNNWQWRMLEVDATPQLAAEIRSSTKMYGRLSGKEKEKGKITSLSKTGRSVRMLTAAEMRDAEKAAVVGGTSYAQLMENAGQAASQAICDMLKPIKYQPKGLAESIAYLVTARPVKKQYSMLMLCGKGNNAGDAFVVARILAEKGWKIKYLPLLGEEFSELAQMNIDKLPDTVAKVTLEELDYSEDIILDGVFGIGFSGALPEHVAEVFSKANRASGIHVALDLPSGLNGDTGKADENTFRADLTLTFGAYKPGLLKSSAKQYCGEVRCLPIGL